MGYKVAINEQIQAQLSFHDMKILRRIRKETNEISCSEIKYDDCMYNVVRKKMLEVANCTVPWVRNPIICTEPGPTNVSFNAITNRF